MQGEELTQFVNRILSINTPMFNLLGGNQGMSGGAISSQSAFSSGGNITLRLKNQTMAFAKAYQNRQTPTETVARLAQIVEGSLMAEATLSLITQAVVSQIINQLHDLLEAR
jgi:hypothetical protein